MGVAKTSQRKGVQLAVVRDGEVLGWIGAAIRADHHSRDVVRLARRMLAQDGLQLASCPVTLKVLEPITPGT